MELKKISKINLQDKFFDSLKADYREFSEWFTRKKEEYAFVNYDEQSLLNAFLYFKEEIGTINDIEPVMPALKRLKIGTLKINAHGTRLGERFIKKALDNALYINAAEVYVTIFPKHKMLISLFKEYGFEKIGIKNTKNGTEDVYSKKMPNKEINEINNYPFIKMSDRIFALSIYPQWHSRLLPDSILNTENEQDIINDVSHCNSIHKIYLTSMRGVENLRRNDILMIYRTGDNQGPAHYRSVITSICVVEDVCSIFSFKTETSFYEYCSGYSVFSQDELKNFYKSKKYKTIIKFSYNYALPRRVNKATLVEDMNVHPDYWGFFKLSRDDFFEIMKKGKANESIVID